MYSGNYIVFILTKLVYVSKKRYQNSRTQAGSIRIRTNILGTTSRFIGLSTFRLTGSFNYVNSNANQSIVPHCQK